MWAPPLAGRWARESPRPPQFHWEGLWGQTGCSRAPEAQRAAPRGLYASLRCCRALSVSVETAGRTCQRRVPAGARGPPSPQPGPAGLSPGLSEFQQDSLFEPNQRLSLSRMTGDTIVSIPGAQQSGQALTCITRGPPHKPGAPLTPSVSISGAHATSLCWVLGTRGAVLARGTHTLGERHANNDTVV